MKLRLLNAGHQALAHAGRLAGFGYAHEAAADPVLADFLLAYLNTEARPTLRPVPGIDLDDYVLTLLARFRNPAIRDTIARLCAYTSDRIPKFVLPAIRANLLAGRDVRLGATMIACWARYAEGVDEDGEPIDVEDALREELMARAAQQRDHPLAFVENIRVFGDLAGNEIFTGHYARALESLHKVGVYGTLRDLGTTR
jgi:mannitol 2-dehydrogenase